MTSNWIRRWELRTTDANASTLAASATQTQQQHLLPRSGVTKWRPAQRVAVTRGGGARALGVGTAMGAVLLHLCTAEATSRRVQLQVLLELLGHENDHFEPSVNDALEPAVVLAHGPLKLLVPALAALEV